MEIPSRSVIWHEVSSGRKLYPPLSNLPTMMMFRIHSQYHRESQGLWNGLGGLVHGVRVRWPIFLSSSMSRSPSVDKAFTKSRELSRLFPLLSSEAVCCILSV